MVFYYGVETGERTIERKDKIRRGNFSFYVEFELHRFSGLVRGMDEEGVRSGRVVYRWNKRIAKSVLET